MKLLVLSDAHANIWALRQVMEQEQDYDYLAFAGDMVDYGIAVVVWRAVQNVVRIPVNVHLGRKKAAQSAA